MDSRLARVTCEISQVLLSGGQVVFSGITRFRPTLRLARFKMNEIILAGRKTQIKKKKKKKKSRAYDYSSMLVLVPKIFSQHVTLFEKQQQKTCCNKCIHTQFSSYCPHSTPHNRMCFFLNILNNVHIHVCEYRYQSCYEKVRCTVMKWVWAN